MSVPPVSSFSYQLTFNSSLIGKIAAVRQISPDYLYYPDFYLKNPLLISHIPQGCKLSPDYFVRGSWGIDCGWGEYKYTDKAHTLHRVVLW